MDVTLEEKGGGSNEKYDMKFGFSVRKYVDIDIFMISIVNLEFPPPKFSFDLSVRQYLPKDNDESMG